MNSPLAAYKTQDVAQVAPDPATTMITMGFGSAQGFELMQRGAKLLASSSLVPTQFQGNISNCTIALNMANRLGADPLMVMQNLYVVHGRPSWSAQFLIASFNQCGRFSSIRYKWGGDESNDDWSCQAYATERNTGDVITGPVITIALAKKEGWYSKSGSKWQSIPQLMLMYRAAAWLVRTHAPEISMGLQTAEEVHDVYDAQSDGNGNYSVSESASSVIDKIRESAQVDGEVIDTRTGEVITQPHGDGGHKSQDAEPIKMADVQNALESSTNMDDLSEAADLIRSVKNKTHRDLLNSVYDKRAAELSGDLPL